VPAVTTTTYRHLESVALMEKVEPSVVVYQDVEHNHVWRLEGQHIVCALGSGYRAHSKTSLAQPSSHGEQFAVLIDDQDAARAARGIHLGERNVRTIGGSLSSRTATCGGST
jgi:hypothetical protein